jgi:hypothetical protein
VFTRPFPGIALATTALIASSAGGVLLVASNAARADLRIQPLGDAFWLSPAGSVSATAGILAASGVLVALPVHLGAIFAQPVAGASAAIAVWESSQ